ncbi:MAG: HD domain-containing phosphohydrolase, partial [Planctomycetia bacterium]
ACLARSPVPTDPLGHSVGDNWRVAAVGSCHLPQDMLPVLLEFYKSKALPLGQPHVCSDRSARTVCPALDPSVRSLLLAPLSYQGENLGLLVGVSTDPDSFFGSDQAQLIANLATQAAGCWKNFLLFAELRAMLVSVVRVLVSAIDAKDPHTCGHSERVAAIARGLAEKIGLDGEQVDNIFLSGLLHDVGKIGVSERILRKAGPLTAEEWEQLRRHPEIGARILEASPGLSRLVAGVRFHHESYNGTGYPLGLEGDDIPLMGRIIAIADSFDAMSTNRPYRAALPPEEVRRVFRYGSGIQWDAELVAAFLEMFEETDFQDSYRLMCQSEKSDTRNRLNRAARVDEAVERNPATEN